MYAVWNRRNFLRAAMAGTAVLARAAQSSGNEIRLFNGVDFTGWDYYLVDEGAKLEDVWSVQDGVIVCKGEPQGYLCTADDYESFRLHVEWRWPGEPGNSGVLMRITGEPMRLPNCVEAQLQSGNAGNMHAFQGFHIGGDPERLSEMSSGWRLNKLRANENEPGEWNRYDITADGDRITLVVNGETLNEATGCDVRPGKIALQSEGALVHFRNVTLTVL